MDFAEQAADTLCLKTAEQVEGREGRAEGVV